MLNITIWVLIDFLFFLVLLCFTSSGFRYRKNGVKIDLKSNNRALILILILLFCIYNKTEGDYFHYKELLNEINSTEYPESHLEAPYIILIKIIGNNYLLFRTIVWGSALSIIWILLKSNNIDNDWGWLCFVIFALIAFAYVRASIGISLYYLGYFTILRYGIKNIIVGLLLIIFSLVFHKSIVLLLVIGCVIPFFRLKLKTIVFLTLAFPLFLSLIYNLIGDFLIALGRADAIKYMNNENTGYGIGMNIQLYFILISIICILLSYFINRNKLSIELSRQETSCLKFVILLFYISLLMLSFQYGVYDLVTRVREMSYIPLAIYFALYTKKFRFVPKMMILGMIMFLLSDFAYFAYMYYLKLIGSGI